MPAPLVYGQETYALIVDLWQRTNLNAKQIARVANVPVHFVYRVKYLFPLFCSRGDNENEN